MGHSLDSSLNSHWHRRDRICIVSRYFKINQGFPGSSEVKKKKKKSACNAGDAADTGSISGSRRYPGEGNGNLLQYSCLENPMYRGAWQATVHGVAKSWTWLSHKTTTKSSNRIIWPLTPLSRLLGLSHFLQLKVITSGLSARKCCTVHLTSNNPKLVQALHPSQGGIHDTQNPSFVTWPKNPTFNKPTLLREGGEKSISNSKVLMPRAYET